MSKKCTKFYDYEKERGCPFGWNFPFHPISVFLLYSYSMLSIPDSVEIRLLC